MVVYLIVKPSPKATLSVTKYKVEGSFDLNTIEIDANTIRSLDPTLGLYLAFSEHRAAGKDDKIHDGQYWCPYCWDSRPFYDFGGTLRCGTCRISENDHYVRTYNGRK